MNRRRDFLCFVLGGIAAMCFLPGRLDAAGPLTPDQVAGRTGAFQLKLTDHDPLSKASEVAKRISLPPSEAGGDYDLSKETFDVYVPKAAADDGKYGVMVLLDFASHGQPPKAWRPVLEKYHLIWIAADNAGVGRPAVERLGLMLDGAYNAKKLWPVDDARVYACIAIAGSAASGAALYFPDVFQGAICSPGFDWIARVPSSVRGRGAWENQPIPAPLPRFLALAKSRGRFFLAARSTPGDPNISAFDQAVLRNGYLRLGFRHAKMIEVPEADMGHFVNYAADWFEEGVQFLDAPVAAMHKLAAQSPTTIPSADGAATDAASQGAKLLSLAKDYIAVQKYDAARTRLQKIVQSYPGTPAAKTAADLLTQIAGK